LPCDGLGPASTPPDEDVEPPLEDVEPPLDDPDDEDVEDVEPPLDEAAPLLEEVAFPLEEPELWSGSVPNWLSFGPAKSSLELAPPHAATAAATMKLPSRIRLFMPRKL
jgi:hypothetical protein